VRVLNTVEINATPATVFYWLEDPSRAIRWMTSVSKTEIIYQRPGMVGTTFREWVEEDGRGTEMSGVVTRFVRGKRLAFHLEGEYNAVDVEYALEDREGHTLLSQRADIRFKGLLRVLSVLFGPTFKRKLTAQTESEFARLKELCERSDSGDHGAVRITGQA
jgi:uncharacterized protein YndB with AHSA1/START domain